MKKILLFIILSITGCTKYNDLDELTIIKSIGISYDTNYQVYAQIIDYIDENNEAHMKVISGRGNTLEKGFKSLKDTINKDTYFSHVDLLVLDKNLHDSNYYDIITFFINNNNFRNDFTCIFAHDVNQILEKTKYDEIEILINSQKNIKKNTKNLNNVIKEYLNNKKIILPDISYNNKLSYLGEYKYFKGDNNVQKNRS